MSLCAVNSWNFEGNTLADDTLDARVIQMWSRKNFNSSLFYTTGFETILFNKSSLFVLETVLASLVAWDNEILITGAGSSLNRLKKTADSLNLNYCSIDWLADKWGDVEQIMTAHPHISYILVGIDCETQLNDIPVNKLLAISSVPKQTLIVYCDTPVEGLNDIFDGAIDFMVAGIDAEPSCSFVVARRSKLVQTEGHSRSFGLDLYSYWQWSMRHRRSVIEPMRV